MSNFKNTIDEVSKLAAIQLTAEEKKLYSEEINSILKRLNDFKEINTENITPLQTVNNQDLIMREDVSQDPNSTSKVLASANHIKYNFFVTPKIVEE